MVELSHETYDMNRKGKTYLYTVQIKKVYSDITNRSNIKITLSTRLQLLAASRPKWCQSLQFHTITLKSQKLKYIPHSHTHPTPIMGNRQENIRITHGGWETHICITRLGHYWLIYLFCIWLQASFWTNAGLFIFGSSAKNLSQMWIRNNNFYERKLF